MCVLVCGVARASEYPGLPAFNTLGVTAKGDPERQQLMTAVDWASANRGWQQHLDALSEAIHRAAHGGTKFQWAQNLDTILNVPNLALALEQARFIQAVGTATLDEFCSSPDQREFIRWLLGRVDTLKRFNGTILPEDKPQEALLQWCAIWKETPENRLENLAIACAVVFDEPIVISADVYGYTATGEESGSRAEATVSGLERFRFYKERFEKGALRTAIDRMEPWELVWVVDAPVPESELLWAQKNVNYSRRDWGKAYSSIRYRMDRATQGKNPYTAYTLEQILKEGGICGDQAYFAAVSAKANGIPGMMITGEGNRGGHAWFGYELDRGNWNLTCGRYNDSYAAGTTIDPQTRKSVKEHELHQRIDPVYRTETYARSVCMLSLAHLLQAKGDAALAAVGCEKALRLAPKNLQAWWTKLDLLKAANVPEADWRRELAKMRPVFREFPDVVQLINERESQYALEHGGATAALKLVRQQKREVSRGERTDLFLENLEKEVGLATQSNQLQTADSIYKDALKRKGDQLVSFKAVAESYYNWAKANSRGPDAVREILSYFNRHHPDPQDDVFAMDAQVEVLSLLGGFSQEQGMDSQARTLERRRTKLSKLSERVGKAESRNSDR